MKRGLLVFISLFLINFVSAQFGYGSFSLTSLFDSINSQDLILLTSFIILFAFLFVILTRIHLFKNAYGPPNKATPAIISFAISLLSIYGIYKSGFNLEELFYGFGLSTDTLYPFIWIILIAAAVFIIWKFKAGIFFLIIGSFIMIVSIFTDLVYEKTTAFFIGIALFIVGVFLQKSARKWWGKNVRSI